MQWRKPNKLLKGADGRTLKVLGEVDVTLASQRGNTTETSAFVVCGASSNLLGKKEIKSLGLVSVVNSVGVENIVTKYEKIFHGLGTLPEVFTIHMKEDAIPYNISTPRRVPVGLREQVQGELFRMKELGVISPIEKSTVWCAGMVVAPKKSGKVRICVDLSQLNKGVKRETYPLPRVEDALASLADAKWFSKMDANSGFWQIKLDEASRELTTFLTPFGRFCFNRMPFGVSSAPENFQRQISKILEGQEGILCHMDDVLVFGKDEEEHDQRLESVLGRIRDSGLTLNREKCQFKVNTIEFLGHKVSSEGIEVCDDKVKAVLAMEAPTNAKGLKRILGMVDYMRKFNPQLAEVESPLRELLKKKNDWLWGSEQEHSFKEMKKMLTSFPLLVKFNVQKRHRITADASMHSLGAALLQEEETGWFPVSYASRTMTEVEKRYAQIEKEALAVTWACQKFDFYLVGRKFQIETDHKPLVPLLGNKDLSQLPLRVQRFKMRLMRYDFDIFHSPGSQMFIADNLSRVLYPEFKDLREQRE